MKNVLVINSGLFGENSKSNQLVELYLKKHIKGDDYVTRRDLTAENLPHLSAAEMQAWSTPSAERSEPEQQLASLSDLAIVQLKAADLLVVGMPMYNMGVPSTFKAYIDRIARAGETFKYTSAGPQGLVNNTKVLVLAARGGEYVDTAYDTQTAYLQTIFALMGMTEVEFIYAEGLNKDEDFATTSWHIAEQKINALS